MGNSISNSTNIQGLLDKVAGINNQNGDERLKSIVRRIVGDLFLAIEELEITESEFWNGLHYMQTAAPEFGLIAPGLGFDRFLDELMDAADKKSGFSGGTPRAIEGPLYVEGAPLSEGYVDMSEDQPGEPMELTGVVKDVNGRAISGAIVDIWHASNTGGYSHFDPSLGKFVFRRRIRTGDDGIYKVKSIVPVGYAVPPSGATEGIMDKLGRHGHRPAHIHFFVSAPGYKHLTTQINIDGDEYLHDDFAFATRDELIVEARKDNGISHVNFDFVLMNMIQVGDENRADRPRTAA